MPMIRLFFSLVNLLVKLSLGFQLISIHLISWSWSNYLMLNVPKTKIMLIGTHQRLSVVDTFLVATDNISLDRVDTSKYLGVTMDGTLSWKEQLPY